MGSGCGKFREEGADKCARVGREEEVTSSNRPELGGVVLALQSAALSEDVLLLCDNEAVLCAIKKWVGQGGRATLATAPDADILRETVCLLTQRVRAGRCCLRCGKGTRQHAHCGRTAYDTPSENKRDGLSGRRQEQQQQSTGQNECGIATVIEGRDRGIKEWKFQR